MNIGTSQYVGWNVGVSQSESSIIEMSNINHENILKISGINIEDISKITNISNI